MSNSEATPSAASASSQSRIPNAALAVLVDRLPPFSGHWSMELIAQWFEWFFDLLDAALIAERQPELRLMVAGDIGWPMQSEGTEA